jgi:deoxyribodipyrimidine photolyase-related protein
VSNGCNIVLVLGDQLGEDNPALAASAPSRDRVLMIETRGEAGHVPSHKQRIALFLSAMRHRAQSLRNAGWTVDYIGLENECPSLADGLLDAVDRYGASRVIMTEAGEWRVQAALLKACRDAGVDLQILDDPHFYMSRDDFAVWASGRKRLVMEHFYRAVRKRFGILMDEAKPVGGRWNFDRDNRGSFGRQGPENLPPPMRFEPDKQTVEVLEDVERHFPGHPGRTDHFGWPVTSDQADAALADFVAHRLPHFGEYQDAMWTGEPFLYHALISASLNLKLLNPRQCIEAAVRAWRDGRAPIQAVEGFVRQIVGWREFIRGVYWLHMPGYAESNDLDACRSLPSFYWDGDTDMNCLSEAIGQTLDYGYAHHIQRLMVTGNFALLAGVDPARVCEWYLAVYVDAVEWVELPNTLGMALHADGGIVGTKPYAASANYIRRMSNYCEGCRYRPDRRTGDEACPFNFLYWDFLARHRDRFRGNRRMTFPMRNLDRIPTDELTAIRGAADSFLKEM